MKKIFKNPIFTFILGAILFSTVGVIAATILSGTEVSYTGNKVSGASNIQQAIDGLYDKAANASTDCATGYTKGNVAADGSYVCSIPAKCQRATTLHTENCESPTTTTNCSGDGYTATGSQGTTTITYGNLGTAGTLATGDAFDCDVNGDGTYDAATERFYYVTDVDTNTAFLIYYNDYVTTTPVAYDAGMDAWTNGPVTAIANLPTTSNWPNVSLTNSVRDIKDDKGAVKKSGFDYGNKAARLITYQEINTACYDGTTAIGSTGGLSSKCKFLMENTRYSKSSNRTEGTWLETASSYYSINAWRVFGDSRRVSTSYANTSGNIGTRPGIEVLKSDISY